MKLIFLYGAAASGKLTIARELAAATGCAVFHNHLVVDAVAAVFRSAASGSRGCASSSGSRCSARRQRPAVR